ncbi:hypothetical protein ACLB2K_060898 [Fragaria x ananassa]
MERDHKYCLEEDEDIFTTVDQVLLKLRGIDGFKSVNFSISGMGGIGKIISPLEFQYSYVVDSEPNSKQRNVVCKYGSARTRDQVLPNSKYLPTTMFSFKLNDENANFWHNASFGKVRKNMLSIIRVSKRKITDKNYKIIIMTENMTKSMKQWCMKKTLTRRAANNVLPPHDGLLAFMSSVNYDGF